MKYKLTLIIADDHYIFRSGLRALLSTVDEVEVIAEANDGEELVKLCHALHPDVVFCDIMMPVMDGIQATRMIVEALPDTMVFAMTMLEEIEKINQMMDAGAKGYLVKDAQAYEILEVLDAAKKSTDYFSETAKNQLVKLGASKLHLQPKPIVFSERELQVIEGICNEKSSRQIAVDLNLSKKTVDYYRTTIMEKIGCKTYHGVINYAHKYKLNKS